MQFGVAGSERRLVRAYVDETGDRGTGVKATRFFGMCAVVVADEDDRALRAVTRELRTTLKVPAGKGLHWRDHVKTFARHQYVTSRYAALNTIVINYVLFEKAAIPTQSELAKDQVVFYNYAAGLLLERIVLTAKDWPGEPRDVVATFAHVRGFDHEETLRYFEVKQQRPPGWMPWNLLRSRPTFADINSSDGLQAADQYAGMLNQAIRPNEFGQYEPQHLVAICHQIRRRSGQAWGYGFKVMALPGCMEAFPWWPQTRI
ncbi:MAG: DUF3800 domain-containing protein [Streptosporangiales bacterium]|nr:DUF3800 domain-containing protein [Streptosporangiales bacterium]